MTASFHSLHSQIEFLTELIQSLNNSKDCFGKISILDELPVVQEFLAKSPVLLDLYLGSENVEIIYVVKSVLAIGQGAIVFRELSEKHRAQLDKMIEQLLEIETFYRYAGGIIGYHLTFLKLILEQSEPLLKEDNLEYVHPAGWRLQSEIKEVNQIVKWGIESLSTTGELYPIGGAGDRLNLMDKETGESLPAAVLPFLGRTLIEGLVRDVQGREYLYFKCYGKQLTIPVAMMTSIEKENHLQISKVFKTAKWFHRSEKSFYFFLQPLVPVISSEGNWSLTAPLTLYLKPCGHGVIWKLAEEQGVFSWFESQNIHHCLVRQINNPVGGTDKNLLALAGFGRYYKKSFGFLSCERMLYSAEGTNVLIKKKNEEGYSYTLTNIEYTDFIKKGIEEIPETIGSGYSKFPANTNVLFADIQSVRTSLNKYPIPGLLINMKSKVSYIDSKGHQMMVPGGRLESTMQNIADSFVDHFSFSIDSKEQINKLKTYILYNERCKTLSTTKHQYEVGKSSNSTPEQAYYDLQANHYELLQKCGFDLPAHHSFEEYLDKGPVVTFLFHPGLGPLYSIIAQKIKRGFFSKGAELQLEIAEVDIQDLSLKGSLLIHSSQPLGYLNQEGILTYGNESRCVLRDVTIINRGIDFQQSTEYWKNQPQRLESVKIILHEGAEFHAEGVKWEGSLEFEVPAGHRLVVTKESQELTLIEQPSWEWNYEFDENHKVKLSKKRFTKGHPSQLDSK